MDNKPDQSYSIQTKEFNLWYGSFQALYNISIDIKPGIITSMIGPSGCGKTTLLRSFNRINERYGNVKTTGSIQILDKNILDEDVSVGALRKRVGMVFQRPNPLPISIYDNVVFGVRAHSDKNTLTTEVLDNAVQSSLTEVGLWNDVKDDLKRKGTELTLEQQQKLCIARLLPLKPDIILMDEPCSALDADGIERIEELIGLIKASYTIVMVTHNMSQARRVSDECIFMYMGEIVEHEATSTIFFNPKNEKTAMYVEGRYG